MRRKINGKYWTIRYIDEDGMFYNVGNWESYDAVIRYILDNTEKLPAGNGAIIRTN